MTNLNARQAVLLKPGDLLILGNTGTISPESHAGLMTGLSELRDSLNLAGIVIFEEDVDLSTIDAAEVERLMERQAERRRQRTQQTATICGQGTGGGEVCFRIAGHDGDCDPDSTELNDG